MRSSLSQAFAIILLLCSASCTHSGASEQSAEEQTQLTVEESVVKSSDSIVVSKNDTAKYSNVYQFRPGRVVTGKLIALTFDDGPNSKATPKVLATLKKYNAVATFFVVGNNLTPSTGKYITQAVEQGCEICSHTWDHPWLTKLSPKMVAANLKKTNEAIKQYAGYYPNFYRPPYLGYNSKVLKASGMPAVSGYSSEDWRTNHTPQRIVNDVMKGAYPNAIIIMHDLGANTRTPRALETLIPQLQKAGYTLVTVSDLFTSAGITPVPGKLYAKVGKGSNTPAQDNKKADIKAAKERKDTNRHLKHTDRIDNSKKKQDIKPDNGQQENYVPVLPDSVK